MEQEQKQRVTPLALSPDYINSQFEDWRAEFEFMITQKQSSSICELINRSVHSIKCRWQYPQNIVDRKKSPKEVAEHMIQIVINGCFDEIFCENNHFDANNKSTYLTQIELFGNIIQRLTDFTKKSKSNLCTEINKRCRKIIHKEMFQNLQFGDKIYFCCGLLSYICKLTKNEGFFWRSVIQTMDKYELWQSAEIFAIMFECYPKQITAHKTAFVQNCFKCIFLGHNDSVSRKQNNNNNDPKISKIKRCYQRLMNVVNDKWNYMKRSPKDKLIIKQIQNTIENNASNAEINGDCIAGILLICACDIGYSMNHFLPKILYPIMRQQFEHKKPVIQEFLLDLYHECCCKIFKRLSKCKQPQAILIKKHMAHIMTTIVSLSISSSSSSTGTNLVDPTVTICCLRHLYGIKTHSFIQSLIENNTHSQQQLLQFARDILKTWSLRLNGLPNNHRQSEEQLFFGLINILSNTFNKKNYKSMAWQTLRNVYRNQTQNQNQNKNRN